jgi:two-component system, LuxR family, sensor kinase FixL
MPVKKRPNSLNAPDEQARLAAIVASSDDAIISKTLDGVILTWNAAAQRLFGYTARQAVGRRVTLIVPRNRRREESLILRRLRRGEALRHYETYRQAKNGRVVPVSVSVAPIRNPDGQVVAASTIMRDMSQRNRSVAALEERRQRMRAILDTAADAIITIDQRGIIESVNAATERLFGYCAAELLGRNVNLLMPEPFHSEHGAYLKQYLRTGIARIIGIGREVTGLRKNQVAFPINLSVSEVRVGGRRLFTGIVHDLTERRRLEQQIMEAAANEQRRIGQDLHDGLCQDLIGIAFGLDALARNLPPGADAAPAEKLAASVRQAAGQARRLAHGLNPVDLKAGGLSAALENLAAKVADSFGVRCGFVWDRLAHVKDDVTATHLYRIAQEAIGNAIRHGHATRVKISLSQRGGGGGGGGGGGRGGSLVLSIIDNGRGIQRAVADSVKQGLATGRTSHSPPAGIGLQTMQYRARVMGGTFSVTPRKGGGTCVTCAIGRMPSLPNRRLPYNASGKVRRAKHGRDR